MASVASHTSLPLLSWLTVLVIPNTFLLIALQTHLFTAPCSANQVPARSKFKAAVYEHSVIVPDDPKEIVSRAEALSLMQRNLDIYQVQAKEAKNQGADILVFPEDGLYGFRFSWESLEPYLEYIPDPTVIDWTPCDDPTRFPDTEVQQALSCMAKNSSLYIVANMGDKQPCHKDRTVVCSRFHSLGVEGHVQYNTDVAFDPFGKLIARYHKEHLFYEQQFDKPDKVEISTFNTPFGRWGMFTCFDILFQEPAITLIEREGIANIAFPTAWMDALPLLASVQFHSAFARGMGVNFLAANIHRPMFRFQGSGVFTPKGMAAFTHNTSHTSEPKLIVTEIDVLDRPQPEAMSTNRNVDRSAEKLEDYIHFDSIESVLENGGYVDTAVQNVETAESVVHSVEYEERAVQIVESVIQHGESPELVAQNVESEIIAKGLQNGKISDLPQHPETAFVSELFHDLFNFVQLDQSEASLHICHRNVCCSLIYSMTEETMNSDLFAFGAFDGLHTYQGTYYLQICALVRCANQSRQSCGSVTSQSSTRFHSLRMRGELQTGYVFPEVLLTTETEQLRLAEAEEWTYQGGIIRSDRGFAYPVLSAALFGRYYEKDSQLPPSDPLTDINTATSISLGLFLVTMCVIIPVMISLGM